MVVGKQSDWEVQGVLRVHSIAKMGALGQLGRAAGSKVYTYRRNMICLWNEW